MHKNALHLGYCSRVSTSKDGGGHFGNGMVKIAGLLERRCSCKPPREEIRGESKKRQFSEKNQGGVENSGEGKHTIKPLPKKPVLDPPPHL